MHLQSMTFKCMGKYCKHKLVVQEAPSEQPWCPKCHTMPMELIAVKAAEQARRQ